MSLEECKAMDRRVIEEIINQGRYEVAHEIFAPEFIYHGPGGQELKGPEGFIQLISTYRNAFPDLRLKANHMVAEGDSIAVHFSSTGTHTGELMGLPATGKKINVSGMIFYRVADGKFIEAWEILEQYTMMQQIGVIPT